VAIELDGDANPRLYLTARVATGLHDVAVIPKRRTSSDATAFGPSSDRTSIVAVVTHADGGHLERIEIDRAAWTPAPASAAVFAQPPGDPATLPVAENPTALTSYAPARDLVPTGWSPIFETVEELGAFAGAATGGIDVIGRHSWQADAAVGSDGRTIGSASYAYSRFTHAVLFGQIASTWRLEQRIESTAGELLRLERKRSAAVGVVLPWQRWRRTTLFSANLELEDRYRENAGDIEALAGAAPVQQEPTLAGGGAGVRFGNTQAAIDIPDPTAESTFMRCKLDWPSASRAPHSQWLAYYRRLLAIRRREIAPLIPDISADRRSFRVEHDRGLFVHWPLSGGRRLALAANLGGRQALDVPGEVECGRILFATPGVGDHGPTMPAWSALFAIVDGGLRVA